MGWRFGSIRGHSKVKICFGERFKIRHIVCGILNLLMLMSMVAIKNRSSQENGQVKTGARHFLKFFSNYAHYASVLNFLLLVQIVTNRLNKNFHLCFSANGYSQMARQAISGHGPHENIPAGQEMIK